MNDETSGRSIKDTGRSPVVHKIFTELFRASQDWYDMRAHRICNIQLILHYYPLMASPTKRRAESTLMQMGFSQGEVERMRA